MIREDYRVYLQEQFKKAGFVLSEIQTDQFLLYYELLIEKNKVMNLTAITEFEDVIQKHFIDSALLLSVSDICCQSVIDVGTGAGFPGIPLKILCPDMHVLLLDSLNKRVLFLNDLILRLKLQNITAIHARAEEAARDPKYREKYDLCVSRAVVHLSSLNEYCLPFVKRGGCFVSYKSASVEQECVDAKKAIYLLGGKLDEIKKVTIPDTEIERSLIFISKERGTSAKYPRKAGIPAKNPL